MRAISFVFCLLTASVASAHRAVFVRNAHAVVADGTVSHAVYGCVKSGEPHTVIVHYPDADTEKNVQLLASITESGSRRASMRLEVDNATRVGCEDSSHHDSHGTRAMGTQFWESFTQTGYEYRQCVPEGERTLAPHAVTVARVTTEATSCVRYSLGVGTEETFGWSDVLAMDLTIARVHLWAGEYYVVSTAVTFFCLLTLSQAVVLSLAPVVTVELVFVVTALAAACTSLLNRVLWQVVFNIERLAPDPEGQGGAVGMTFGSLFAHGLLIACLVYLADWSVRYPRATRRHGASKYPAMVGALVLSSLGILGVQTLYVATACVLVALAAKATNDEAVAHGTKTKM